MDVRLRKQEAADLALHQSLKIDNSQSMRTRRSHSVTVNNLLEPVADPRLRLPHNASGPTVKWLDGAAGDARSAAVRGDDKAAAAAADVRASAPLAGPGGGGGGSGGGNSSTVSAAAVTAAAVGAAAAAAAVSDEEEFVDPLLRELFQLYRIRVRGWFEAAHFTRRTVLVLVLVFVVDDLVWRQVGCC